MDEGRQRLPSSSSQLGWLCLSVVAGRQLRARPEGQFLGVTLGAEPWREVVGWKGVMVSKMFLDMTKQGIWISHRATAVPIAQLAQGRRR